MPKYTAAFFDACKEFQDHIAQGQYEPQHFAGLAHRYLGKFMKCRAKALIEDVVDEAAETNPPDNLPFTLDGEPITREQIVQWKGIAERRTTDATNYDHIDIGMGDIVSVDNIRRWRQHSKELNQIARWMSVQMGKVQPYEEQATVDVDQLLIEFKAKVAQGVGLADGTMQTSRDVDAAFAEAGKEAKKKRKWKKRAKKAEERIIELDRLRDKMKDEAGVHHNISFDELWPSVLGRAKHFDATMELLGTSDPGLTLDLIRALLGKAVVLTSACEYLGEGTVPTNFVERLAKRLYTKPEHAGIRMVSEAQVKAAVEKVHETARSLRNYADTLEKYGTEKSK